MKANSIPLQYAVWSRFQELANRNQEVLHGVVENVPEFASAFGCSAGQPMVAAHGCRVW